MRNSIKNRRIIFILSIVAIIFGGFLIFSSVFGMELSLLAAAKHILNSNTDATISVSEEAVLVKTKKASFQLVTEDISLSGLTKPLDEIKVSSKISGKVVALYFNEGGFVAAGQTIVQLEQDQISRVAYNNAQTNLINTRASMEQDIKTAEIAVEAADTILVNAGKSLNNTGVTNEQTIIGAYASALNISRDAVLTGVNALVSLTDIQYKYINSNDHPGACIAEKKAIAIYALLGQSGAGRYSARFIGPLNGGVKGQVEEAISNPTHEKIDQILIDAVLAIQKVRDALGELRPNMDWKQTTAAEKTIIDTARAGVESSLTALSVSEQTIMNAKLGKTAGNDAVQSAYDSAKKQLESAEANLASVKKRAELQIAVVQGQLDSAQARLSNTIIIAPISGVINQKFIEIGEMAMAGSPVVSIVNIKSIEIELFLTEFDIGKVFIGQEVQTRLAAYPSEEFIGEIYYISAAANPASKKFPIKIQLNNRDGKIKAGMVAETKIITKKQENVLMIPKTSVFIKDGVEKVYIIEDSIVKIKTVIITVDNDENARVIEGLREGEEVIVQGNFDLREGERVIIQN